ncbi:hypothetical protein GUJ93_ZPchr0014g46625 [Zizania palustris]|uniref:Uncharacterized protein n=1 Tax=Zizania palustris TaxID=103762 RepID=A0A8J5THN6_ZIZPA|nr:hypothetical protein GUJ93_ZPchr0014g46625 [Zizania palustris]
MGAVVSGERSANLNDKLSWLRPCVAAPSTATRKKLQREFRLRGFTLKQAATFLARFSYAKDNTLDILQRVA